MGPMLMSAVGVVLLAGCGGSNGRADAAPEGGGGANGDAGGICSSLVPPAAATFAATTMPAPAPDVAVGGTITSGTYFPTSAILYVVPTCTVLPAAPAAAALRFTASSATAGIVEMALAVTVQGEQHLIASSSSYTLAGTTMTRTLGCYWLDGVDATTGDGGVSPGQVTSDSYTATATEIRTYATLGPAFDAGTGSCGTEVLVLQKQPD